MKTTIQIDKQTLTRLQHIKIHPNESYNAAINRLLDENEEEELTNEEISELQESLEEVKQGKVISLEKAAKELSVDL